MGGYPVVLPQLREYQAAGVRDVRRAFSGGDRRVILTAPTGSGKRYIAVWCSLQAGEQNKRILIVTHRKILVDQMVQELRVHGAHVGVLMAGYEEPNPIAPIQVASLQTLWSRCLRQGCYGKPLPEAQLIVIDECHQEPRRYHKLLEHYPRAWVMGLTATPVGREGLRLDDFHAIVEGSLNSQLIHDGWLLPTVVYAPSEPDVTGVTIQRGDYSQKKLSRRVREVTLWGDIWKEYAKHEDSRQALHTARAWSAVSAGALAATEPQSSQPRHQTMNEKISSKNLPSSGAACYSQLMYYAKDLTVQWRLLRLTCSRIGRQRSAHSGRKSAASSDHTASKKSACGSTWPETCGTINTLTPTLHGRKSQTQ
jgi:superfamily II DNA or RNA helicase